MNLPEAEAEEGRLTASDMVLMFAGDFVEAQEDGYQAPCSEAQVKLGSLVREMLTTAFISLASQGVIELTLGKKKRLFSEYQTAFVVPKQEPPEPLGGLEGAVLKNLRGRVAEDSVRDAVNRIVGSTTIEPYSALLEMSMENACRAGYFQEQERTGTAALLGRKTLPKPFQPRCERIATLAPRAAVVQQMRGAFVAQYPELCEVLYQDVEKSVRSAYFRT